MSTGLPRAIPSILIWSSGSMRTQPFDTLPPPERISSSAPKGPWKAVMASPLPCQLSMSSRVRVEVQHDRAVARRSGLLDHRDEVAPRGGAGVVAADPHRRAPHLEAVLVDVHPSLAELEDHAPRRGAPGDGVGLHPGREAVRTLRHHDPKPLAVLYLLHDRHRHRVAVPEPHRADLGALRRPVDGHLALWCRQVRGGGHLRGRRGGGRAGRGRRRHGAGRGGRDHGLLLVARGDDGHRGQEDSQRRGEQRHHRPAARTARRCDLRHGAMEPHGGRAGAGRVDHSPWPRRRTVTSSSTSSTMVLACCRAAATDPSPTGTTASA